MAQADATVGPSSGGLAGWELVLPTLVPVLGGIAYASFRAAYLSFYSRFGASPEDVGLNYGQVLAGSVWPILGVSLLIAMLIQSYTWHRRRRAGWQQRTRDRRRLRKSLQELEVDIDRIHGEMDRADDDDESAADLEKKLQNLALQRKEFQRQWDDMSAVSAGPTRFAMVILSATFVFLLAIAVWITWAIPHDLNEARRRVREGRAVGASDLHVLAMQADRAHVAWVGNGQMPQELASAKLMFLGHADGVAVFYDPITDRGLRASERQLVVRVLPDPN